MTSPDLAEELAADLLLTRLTVAHDAAARGEDRDAHARTDTGDAIEADVDAAARSRHATNAVDGARLVLAVAEDEREGLASLAFALAHVIEIALALEHVGDVLLEVGVRHVHAVVPREAAVADASEHVANGIGHHGFTSSP